MTVKQKVRENRPSKMFLERNSLEKEIKLVVSWSFSRKKICHRHFLCIIMHHHPVIWKKKLSEWNVYAPLLRGNTDWIHSCRLYLIIMQFSLCPDKTDWIFVCLYLLCRSFLCLSPRTSCACCRSPLGTCLSAIVPRPAAVCALFLSVVASDARAPSLLQTGMRLTQTEYTILCYQRKEFSNFLYHTD